MYSTMKICHHATEVMNGWYTALYENTVNICVFNILITVQQSQRIRTNIQLWLTSETAIRAASQGVKKLEITELQYYTIIYY